MRSLCFLSTEQKLIFTICLYKFCNKDTHSSNNIFEEEHLLLELLEDTFIRCPQHVMDLGYLVQLIGSREERIQTETHRYLTAMTKPFT